MTLRMFDRIPPELGDENRLQSGRSAAVGASLPGRLARLTKSRTIAP
jgi:hypothetical protein